MADTYVSFQRAVTFNKQSQEMDLQTGAEHQDSLKECVEDLEYGQF